MKIMKYKYIILALILFVVVCGYSLEVERKENIARDIMRDLDLKLRYTKVKLIDSNIEWSDGWKYTSIVLKDDIKSKLDEQVSPKPYLNKTKESLVNVKSVSSEEALKKVMSVSSNISKERTDTFNKMKDDFSEGGEKYFYTREVNSNYQGDKEPFYDKLSVLCYDRPNKKIYLFSFSY